VSEGDPRTYGEFWPFYVSQHLHPVNRLLHAIGTTGVFVTVVAAAAADPAWLAAAPLCGYGFAWLGHFAFERNRPATFRYPLWSLRGDFHMYALMLAGRMEPELDNARRLFPEAGRLQQGAQRAS
jgi:hypothetical protein